MALSAQKAQFFQQHLFPKYKKSIAFFAHHLFGTTLSPKQIEFAEAFQRSKRITFKGGAGFGKTHVMAVVFWWSLICHDNVKVTIFGPSEQQIKTGIWNEILMLHGKMSDEDIKDAYEATATKIDRKTRPNDCLGVFKLANKENVENARGIHAPNNFIFVDEATGVPDEVFDAFKGIFRDNNPKLCLISNPTRTSGRFWETWNDPAISDRWTKVHGQSSDKPGWTQEDAEEAKADYGGEFSREYRMMVLGEFPLSDEDGLIPRNKVEEAALNTDAVPAPNKPIIWGLDPAGQGGDRSVLIKRHDNVVLDDPKVWKGLEPATLAYAVRDLYFTTEKAEQPKFVCVDAIGIGNGIASMLKELGVPVKAVVVSNTPTRRPEFFNRLRDQLWWECRDWFVKGNVSIPKHSELINELCFPTYDTERNGKVKVEDKKSIRKRMSASPDFADALCLTFAVSSTSLGTTADWTRAVDYGDLRCFE